MKKLGILFTILMLMAPSMVSAKTEATTLAELRQELKNLQNQKSSNEKQKQLTKAEKNAKNVAIANAYKEIETSESKIEEAKNSIKASEQKISEYEAKTKEMLEFYQMMMGDNSYLEFITDSSSMTEMIMRIDAVEEIVNYNQDTLKKLEGLIDENEQKQVELKKYEQELNNNITSYQKKIQELDSSLMEMEDIAMDIDEEIKIVQTNIKTYENMGCGENEKFDVCAKYSYNSTWLKPVTKGRINSLFGYRNVSGQSSNHSGIDIGVSEGTPVYSATNGTVVYIIRKSSCGGNQIYIQSDVNGTTYTMQYAHLLKIEVSLGQTVKNTDVIAYSGGGSTATRNGGYDRCTTGAHLHYGVSKSKWTTWKNYTANLINPPGFPGKGGWFYERTQWFR